MASWQVPFLLVPGRVNYIHQFLNLCIFQAQASMECTMPLDWLMLSNDEQSPPYQLPTDPVLATAIPSATSSHVLPWWEFSLVFLEKIVLGLWYPMVNNDWMNSSLNFSTKTRVLWLEWFDCGRFQFKILLKQMSTLPAGFYNTMIREKRLILVIGDDHISHSFAPVTPGIYYLLVAYYPATCYFNRNLP